MSSEGRGRAISYDCIIIGGGIAGLQASIQLGRYKRSILLLDSEDGRSSLCKNYNNILGFSKGVSGKYLREEGRKQAAEYGVEILNDEVVNVRKEKQQFLIETRRDRKFKGKTMLLATGVKDHIPSIPGILPCLGSSIYICPDCDGYEISNKKTFILGSGMTGVSMALRLLYWSQDLTYINHGEGEVKEEAIRNLQRHNIAYINHPLIEVKHVHGKFLGIQLTDGSYLEGEKAFVAFGGNKVRSDLAAQLEAEMNANNHIAIDPTTRMTTINNLWAAGDAASHSELVTAAMADGSVAAIWIQKRLNNEF
ncbi:NAD(P)/FAD-dependent oxidoreductase [Halobacillus rhizosphaerae]|uniref:NAD(P)/FAD-dependent oxidoreductase n=1 Tax=Halobacillus rhizosphaerae TaxID=3064889 RepID=UPI00398B114A